MSVGKKLNKKYLLSNNLATKHGYCTQLVYKHNCAYTSRLEELGGF